VTGILGSNLCPPDLITGPGPGMLAVCIPPVNACIKLGIMGVPLGALWVTFYYRERIRAKFWGKKVIRRLT
jgi:hypothetical protein